MRKRGLYFLIAAAPALVWVSLIERAARQSPAGYEYGSVVWPIPLHIRLVGAFGMFCTLVGLLLLAYDFGHRKTKLKNELTNQIN